MAAEETSHYLAGLKYDPANDKRWVTKYLGNFRLPLLLILSMLFYGIFGYINLPRRINPEVRIPIVFVSTVLPGANPQDVESLVTIPLENAIRGVDKINQVNSTSQENASFISVEFNSSVDPDKAVDDVQSVVNTVSLPDDAMDPSVVALDFEDVPVWSFTVTSNTDTASLMRFSSDLRDRLENVTTLKKVNVSGSEIQEIQITIAPEIFESYGFSPIQVQQAIQAEIAALPGGLVRSNGSTFTVSIDPLVTSVDDLRNVIISIQNQSYRLGNIAMVQERSSPNQTKAFYVAKGNLPQRAVTFSVYKTTSANIDKAAKDAKAVAEEFRASYGDRFAFVTIIDFDKEINQQFSDLFSNFNTSILLVFVTLFLFLGIRQASIASIVIPISFLFTFGFMNTAGLTLSFISLFSLLLAQGMIVDDTIVIISAMTDYYKSGKFTPKQVGVLVWDDFIIPILTSNLTNVWSFLPLLLASGIIGEFIRVLPIVVIAALIGSTAIALLVTIPLMVVILKPNIPLRVKWLLYILGTMLLIGIAIALAQISILFIPLLFAGFFAAISFHLTALKHQFAWYQPAKITPKVKPIIDHGVISLEGPFKSYRNVLHKILHSPKAQWKTIGAVVIFSLASYMLVPLGLVKNEFFPKTDQEIIYAAVELPIGTSLQKTTDEALRIMPGIIDKSEVKSVSVNIGTQPMSGSVSMQPESNLISYSINLTDPDTRDIASFDIAQSIRDTFKNYSAGTFSVIEETGGPPAGADIQISLLGPDLGELNTYADDTLVYLKTVPGIVDADKAIKPGISKLSFVPNREALADAGITVSQVGFWLRTYASGTSIDEVRFGNDEELDITLRTSGAIQTPEGLGSLTIPNQQGDRFPLLSLGTFTVTPNPTRITRQDGERTITVTASVLPGYNIPEIGKNLEQFADSKLGLADEYSWKTGGINEENQQSVNSIFQAMIVAAILIAATMVLQLGSFRKAFIVMLTIPLAVSGVFIMFGLTGTPLSFPALIGVLALFGIVVKNSIMIVDKINLNLNSGIPFSESVLDGSTSRLEPIIFSSITNFIGLIPITISDPLWQGLGGAIIYGLLFSGTIMLFFIPVVFYLMFKPAKH